MQYKLSQLLKEKRKYIHNDFNNLLYNIQSGPLAFIFSESNGSRKKAIMKAYNNDKSEVPDDSLIIDSRLLTKVLRDPRLQNVLVERDNSRIPWFDNDETYLDKMISSFLYFINDVDEYNKMYEKVEQVLSSIYETCQPIMRLVHENSIRKLIETIKRDKRDSNKPIKQIGYRMSDHPSTLDSDPDV